MGVSHVKHKFDISTVDISDPVQNFAYTHLVLGEMYNLTPSADLKREIVLDIIHYVRDNAPLARQAFDFIRSMNDSEKSEFVDKFSDLSEKGVD